MEQALAFALFALVAAGTPGPSNTLLVATGARVGVARGLRALLGQGIGMGVMIVVVALGLGALVVAQPGLVGFIRWSGVAFMLWLAWRIASSSGHLVAEGDTRPIGFLGLATFQWVNPKAWLITTSAAASFADAGADQALHAIVLGALFTAVALVICFPWLALGAAIQRVLRTDRSMRVFNIVMGMLLALSVLPLVFESLAN